MVKYQLQKNIEEYDEKDKNKIEEGCTFGGPDVEPEAIGDYTTEEAARKALERYRSYVCKYTYEKIAGTLSKNTPLWCFNMMKMKDGWILAIYVK